jgi:hypothetical protein
MEILQGLGSQGAIVVGFVSTAAEILVGFLFFRAFKIIRRREYARLKATEAEHQRCQPEWDRMFTLDSGAEEIRIASQHRGDDIKVEPEFEAPELARSHR